MLIGDGQRSRIAAGGAIMLFSRPPMIRKQGEFGMKLVSTALLAAGLMTLAACGGGATNNTADANAVDENLTIPADDLGNLSDNVADANAVDANAVDANAAAPADANATNAQ
jgi:hypothetical protein